MSWGCINAGLSYDRKKWPVGAPATAEDLTIVRAAEEGVPTGKNHSWFRPLRIVLIS